MIWISVKEKLPEMGVRVFGVVDGQIGVFARGDAGDDTWLWGNCYGCIDGDALMDDEYDVTHWMPLPEPPDEKEGK
ncbi:MAG: DUF551 domain-containing protein [Patescibacteria group bacterium]|nr:DUF551 domain-containing protein [Patescibacteria group bacterium]